MYIVIRAGGLGTRLWPVSREKKPKQFHPLTGERSMLEEAIDRVGPVAKPANIFISVHSDAEELVYQLNSAVPKENVIVEPQRKDTSAAIGLESIIIAHRDPEAIVASLGSDHSVRRVEEFQRMLWIAEEFVRRHPEYIIPIGIRSTRPDTGYGYIQTGEVLDTFEGKNLWKVDRFIEKPDIHEAKEFVSQANFLWNSNMFVWKVSTILELYKTHLPKMYDQLMEIADALGTDKQQQVIEAVYPHMEQIAIDYSIVEKTSTIAALAADIGWSDVGDWARLKDELSESEAENVVVGAEHVSIQTANTLVYSQTKGKIIATVGINNLVIVDTPDALLISDKYHTQEVKDIVKKLQDRNKTDVL